MKFLISTKQVLLAAALVGLSACDDYLDVNQSPNAVLLAPSPNVLVAGQTHLGFLMGSDLYRFSSLIGQQLAGQGGPGIQQAEFDRYSITATDVNNVWRGGIYGGAQADLQKLIDQTQTNDPRYAGVAKIMQGFLFSVTTDAFGDIPFSEALRFDQNLQPKYDASQDVYAGIIALLNAGLDDLKKASAQSPGDDDLIYGGNLERWERFANTLKLRLYLHAVPKTATFNPDFAAVLAANRMMRDNADNFQMRFENAANRQNPIDQYEKARANQLFPSTTLVNLMNTKSDPRRTTFFTEAPAPAAPAPPNPPGTFVGAQNGTGAEGAPNSNFSRMHVYLRGARTGTGVNDYDGTAPIRMLTFAEHNFILAEYYARTNNLALAQSSYNAGIRASMADAGITTAATVTAYVTDRPALTAANAIQQIIEEKFVANYGVAVEPWTDFRRTRIPALLLPAGALQPQILRILPYPDLERVANPGNTPARPNLTTPSVFWDPGT